MALTEQDKIECRDIAYRIIKEVMSEHIQTCPHGMAMKYSKKMIAATIIGVILGSGLINGGIVLAAIKLMFT